MRAVASPDATKGEEPFQATVYVFDRATVPGVNLIKPCVAFVFEYLPCQMQANPTGVEFLETTSKFSYAFLRRSRAKRQRIVQKCDARAKLLFFNY